MKRLLLLLLAFIMTMAGCSQKAPISDTSSVSATSKPAEITKQETEQVSADIQAEQTISLSVNGTAVSVRWEENASVQALSALLMDGDIAIRTERYGGFEQVGGLPQPIPRDDVQMTTEAGDIVLYSGNSIVLFYGSNTWAYTTLGHIEGLSADEWKALLNRDHTTVTLSMSK